MTDPAGLFWKLTEVQRYGMVTVEENGVTGLTLTMK